MAVLRTASTTPRHHHQQMLIERPSRHVMIKTSFRSSVPATFLHTVTRFTGLSLSIRSEPPCLHIIIIIIISIIMIISGITIHIAITFLFASPGQASIGSPYPSPPPPDHPPGFQSGMTRSKIANPASPPLPPPCPAVPPPSSPFARPTSLPPAGSLHACSD